MFGETKLISKPAVDGPQANFFILLVTPIFRRGDGGRPVYAAFSVESAAQTAEVEAHIL
jgi:hypothetical protein